MGSGGGRKLWLAPPNCLSESGPSQALRESGPAFPVGSGQPPGDITSLVAGVSVIY